MAFVDQIQVIGFAKEATPETDPITLVNSNYWLLGNMTQQHGLPVVQHEWVPVYFDNRDPTEMFLNKSITRSTVGFLPVNTVQFYQYLGVCSTTADPGNVHTITGLNTGNLETFTLRMESRGGAADKFWTTLGNRVANVTFSVNFRQPEIPAVMAVSYIGIKQATATLNETHTTGVKYPTDTGAMGGTENSNPYRIGSDTVFTWDGDSYIDAIRNFTYQGVNIFAPHWIQNQNEVEFLFEGKRTQIVGWDVLMGKSSNMFTDFQAKSLKNSQLKIFNSATNYLQLDFTDVGLEKMEPVKHPTDWRERVYRCEAKVRTTQVTSLDGIKTTGGAAEFYGE